MADPHYRKIAIDIPGIKTSIRKLQPETITLEEILKQLEPDIRDQVEAGVPLPSIVKALQHHGVKVTARRLNTFLNLKSTKTPSTPRSTLPEASE